MDKYEQRRLRLLELRDTKCGGVSADLARKIGKDPSYVARMFYEEGKAGKKRIGEDTVEAVRRAFGLPRGWMDGDIETVMPSELLGITGTGHSAQKANVSVAVGAISEPAGMAAIRATIDEQHAAQTISDEAATLLRAALGAAAREQEPATRAAILLMLTSGLRPNMAVVPQMDVDPTSGDSPPGTSPETPAQRARRSEGSVRSPRIPEDDKQDGPRQQGTGNS
jgi:hypothetical protein